MLRYALILLCLTGCNVFASLDATAGGDCTTPPVTLSVDVAAAYLLADPTDSPAPPLVINLADIGFLPGDQIELEVDGGYLPSRLGEPVLDEMGAVFSASDTLLEQSEQFRVVDAIAAGTPFVTRPTFRDDQETDIPEDFYVEGASVVIPEGATHLFAAAMDSLFSDNGSMPDQPYDISIQCAGSASGP